MSVDGDSLYARVVYLVSTADSHRWTWTLGLLTAASACLLPVGAEASVDGSDELETPCASSDAAAPCGILECAHYLVDLCTERASGSGVGRPTRQSWSYAQTSRLNLVGVRSQLLQPPGPPIYLIAPSQSPPVPSLAVAPSVS